MSYNTTIRALVTALKKIPTFSSPDYINRLHDKARHSPNIGVFFNSLISFPTFGPDPDSLIIDNVDASAYLTLLAEATAVQALSNLDPSVDGHNLRSCANHSNAQISNGTLLTNLTSLLYGEYINTYLRSVGLPDLHTLSTQPGLADAFAAQLKVPQFIQGEVYTDMAAAGDHKFSLSLLFACDYLHHGPGLIPSVDADYLSAPSSTVVNTWTQQLSQNPKASMPDVVAFCSKAASIVCATTDSGHIKPMPISRIARNIFGTSISANPTAMTKQFGLPSSASASGFSSSLESALNDLQITDVDQWKSIAQQNLLLWNNNATKWQSAVGSVAGQSTSTTKDISNQFAEGFVIGLTAGLEDHKTFQTTTITGQAVADWVNEGYHSYTSLFNGNAPSVTSVSTHDKDGPVHSCFVAGTQVTLADGSIAIEELTEGTRILTRADSQEFGTVSDEDVVNQLNLPLLVGINDDEPFFTPGHVFHTTTGLRAVEPNIARQENSWLDVGTLGQGHVLLKLGRDGRSYDHVEIKSIRIVKSDVKEVYGVHLREGQRSYHANGYLVAVNYPEITVKSIARALAKVPRAQRVGMLQNIKELKPLFQKFGVNAMSDALERELSGKQTRTSSKPVKPKKNRQTNIAHAKRTFNLLPSAQSATQQQQHLPQLSIHEGIVRLDNEVEPRATVDAASRTVQWSRNLPKGQYEHGYVELRDHGLSGAGAILVNQNADQATMPTGDNAQIIPFNAVKANVTVSDSPVQSPLQHAQVSKKEVTATPLPGLPVSKFAKVPGLPNLPGLQQSPNVLLASVPTSSAPTATALSSTASATPIPVVPSASPVPSLIDGQDYYNMTLDSAVWAPGQTVTSPSSPVPFGMVAFATYHSGGAGGYSMGILTVPILDQLLAAINQIDGSTPGSTPLKSLYSSEITLDDDGNMMGDLTFDQAALVSQYADQNITQNPPIFGLTFTKALKSNIMLPILFSRMQVSVDAMFINATGVAYEFDPNMRGNLGNKHFMTNDATVPSATVQTRLANSQAVVAKVSTGKTPNSLAASSAPSPAPSPAPVTKLLATATTPSVDNLISGVQKTYDDAMIHTISGGLLQKTMLYHMNSNDRTNFLQLKQPTDLDPSLGAGLATSLHNWIQNTYAVAFVSYMISQTSDQDQQTWRQHFTDDEKGKIWYWFSGQGATCLSQSKEYNGLNSACAQIAMKTTYFNSTTMSTYYNNGAHWAQQMYQQMSTPVNGINPLQSLLNHQVIGTTNVINMRCNILNTLDPSGNYANLIFNDILALSAANLNGTPYIGLGPNDPNPDQRSQFVTDAMRDLIVEILSGAGSALSWDADVQASLLADLTQLEKDEGLSMSDSAQDRANALCAKAVLLVQGITNVMPALADLAKNGSFLFKSMTGWKKATAAYDWCVAKLPATESKIGIAFKGVMTAVMIGFTVASAVKSFMDFNILSPDQRSIVIFSTLQIVVDSLKGAKEIYDRYKKYKNPDAGTKPDAPQQVKDAAVLDEKLDAAVAQSAPVLDDAAKKITPADPPDLALKNSVARTISSGSMPKDAPITDEVKNNVKIEETPKKPIGLNGKAAEEAFSVTDQVIKGIGAAVGIGMTVSMAMDLKHHWGDMNTLGQALNTIQVVTTGLTVLCDLGEILAESAVEFSLFAVSEAVLTAIPFVGAVLAVVGIVVMIVMEFEDTQKPPVPPPTPVETFISGAGRTLIATWVSPPKLLLHYDVQPTVRAGRNDQEWKVWINNPTKTDITLNNTDINFNTGDDSTSIFTNLALAFSTARNAPSTENTVWVGDTETYIGTLRPTPSTETVTSWDINITGVPMTKIRATNPDAQVVRVGRFENPTGLLYVPAGGNLEAMVFGKAGAAQGPMTVTVTETLVSGDKARGLFSVNITA